MTDRALDGAGSACQSDALERGAGGCRARESGSAVAQYDLAVGADVDEQGRLLALQHLGGENPGADVASHIRGDAGKQVDLGFGCDDATRQDGVSQKRRRERQHSQRGGVDARHEMEHGRVAGDDHSAQVGLAPVGAAESLFQKRQDRLGVDCLLEWLEHRRVLGAELDPGDHVVPELRLLIEGGGLPGGLAALQVHERQSHGCRPDVHRRAYGWERPRFGRLRFLLFFPPCRHDVLGDVKVEVRDHHMAV